MTSWLIRHVYPFLSSITININNFCPLSFYRCSSPILIISRFLYIFYELLYPHPSTFCCIDTAIKHDFSNQMSFIFIFYSSWFVYQLISIIDGVICSCLMSHQLMRTVKVCLGDKRSLWSFMRISTRIIFFLVKILQISSWYSNSIYTSMF